MAGRRGKEGSNRANEEALDKKKAEENKYLSGAVGAGIVLGPDGLPVDVDETGQLLTPEMARARDISRMENTDFLRHIRERAEADIKFQAHLQEFITNTLHGDSALMNVLSRGYIQEELIDKFDKQEEDNLGVLRKEDPLAYIQELSRTNTEFSRFVDRFVEIELMGDTNMLSRLSPEVLTEEIINCYENKKAARESLERSRRMDREFREEKEKDPLSFITLRISSDENFRSFVSNYVNKELDGNYERLYNSDNQRRIQSEIINRYDSLSEVVDTIVFLYQDVIFNELNTPAKGKEQILEYIRGYLFDLDPSSETFKTISKITGKLKKNAKENIIHLQTEIARAQHRVARNEERIQSARNNMAEPNGLYSLLNANEAISDIAMMFTGYDKMTKQRELIKLAKAGEEQIAKATVSRNADLGSIASNRAKLRQIEGEVVTAIESLRYLTAELEIISDLVSGYSVDQIMETIANFSSEAEEHPEETDLTQLIDAADQVERTKKTTGLIYRERTDISNGLTTKIDNYGQEENLNRISDTKKLESAKNKITELKRKVDLPEDIVDRVLKNIDKRIDAVVIESVRSIEGGVEYPQSGTEGLEERLSELSSNPEYRGLIIVALEEITSTIQPNNLASVTRKNTVNRLMQSLLRQK